jgi:hypothetical protein
MPKKTEGLKLSGTHQCLFYANDVNLLGENINIIKKNTETLVDAKLEKKRKLSILMFMSPDYRTKSLYCINIANKTYENGAKFKHLRMMVTNQNYIHEEIKGRLNSGSCEHSSEPVISIKVGEFLDS